MPPVHKSFWNSCDCNFFELGLGRGARGGNQIDGERALGFMLVCNHHARYMPLNQSEKILAVTQSPLQHVSRKRRHYTGSNRGNVIGPVALPMFDSPEVWKLMSSIKKQMFGSFGATIPVGGTLPVAPDVMKKYNEHQAALRGSKVPVPAFYHAPPVKLCEELEHCYNLEAIPHSHFW